MNRKTLTLMGMLGLTTLTASATGFYRFEQWSAPVWGNPALQPGTTYYYWYQPFQPLPGNPPANLSGQSYPLPGQAYYWYQFAQPQPQPPSPGLPAQSFQGPNYWYWYQPYY